MKSIEGREVKIVNNIECTSETHIFKFISNHSPCISDEINFQAQIWKMWSSYPKYSQNISSSKYSQNNYS